MDQYSGMTSEEKSRLLIERQKKLDRLEEKLNAEIEETERIRTRNAELESLLSRLSDQLVSMENGIEEKYLLLSEMSQKLDRIAAKHPDPDKPSPREAELLRIIANLQAELSNRNTPTYVCQSEKHPAKSKDIAPEPKD